MANAMTTWTTGPTIDGTRGTELIERMLGGRSITEMKMHGAISERHHDQIAEINAQPWNDQEKARRCALVLEATREALAKDLEDTIKARSREFDQLEGAAIAAARRNELLEATDAQVRREQTLFGEWTLVIAGIPSETKLSALEMMAEDAKLTDNPRIYRSVLSAITQQTGRLAAIERKRNSGGPMGPTELAHAKLEGEFTKWRRENPTPAERRRQAAEGRERMRMEIERSAQVYRQCYGLDSAR